MSAAVLAAEGVVQKPYHIEASIGMSYRQIEPSMNIENMILLADEAMYQMKQHK